VGRATPGGAVVDNAVISSHDSVTCGLSVDGGFGRVANGLAKGEAKFITLTQRKNGPLNSETVGWSSASHSAASF